MEETRSYFLWSLVWKLIVKKGDSDDDCSDHKKQYLILKYKQWIGHLLFGTFLVLCMVFRWIGGNLYGC